MLVQRRRHRHPGAAPVLAWALVVLGASLVWWPAGAVRAGQASAAPSATPGVAGATRYVDRNQLMQAVATLASPSFEGRRTGTAGGMKARLWIADQFASIRLTPLAGSTYVQTFALPARDRRGRESRSDHEPANVVGRLDGNVPRARTIVVTAHYDHLGIRDGVLYPGADDNASGVAALLAAARYFTAARPQHPMVFAALDAEELGQLGAKALLASGVLTRSRISLNVNLDMVSRSAGRELYAAGTYHSPWQLPILLDVQARAAVNLRFGHDRPARRPGDPEDWTHSSDHGPFHDAKIPFVYFGVEDHPAYHKATDTAGSIDPDFFGDSVDTIIEALRAFDAKLN